MSQTRNGSGRNALTLSDSDARVRAAREAESRLYGHYGISFCDHAVNLSQYDVNIRVTEVGAGEPVMIVPGNTGDVFPFAPLLAELAGVRLLAVNRPGGGLSDGMDHSKIDFHQLAVDTISAVMDAFHLESAVLMGHSIGAHWCQWFAMDRPDRVRKLILLGVPGNIIGTSPPFALRLLLVPHLNSLLYQLVMNADRKDALGSLKFMGHPRESVEKLPQAMAECYHCFQRLPHYKISSLTMMERINRLRGSRPKITITQDQLGRIAAPTLMLWGGSDPFGSVETGKKIAGMLRRSEFHEIPASGHLPWLDRPKECGDLIEGFISNDH